jgi:hypothetical protein
MVTKNRKSNTKVLLLPHEKKGECRLAIAGWNCGNHFTKVVLEGREITFPSYVAEGRERGGESYPNTHINDLDVRVNDEWWFIGELASRYDDMRIAYDKFKAEDDATRACLLTATAYLEATSTDKKSLHLNVQPVACLPISDYIAQRERFAKYLTGVFNVQLPHQKVTIEVTNPTIAPEGGCAAWDLFLDDKGNELTTYSNKKIAIIDIGSRTTNVAVLNDMAFIPEQSDTLQLGMWDIKRDAAKEIKKTVDVLPHQYDDHLDKVKDWSPYYNRFIDSLIKNIRITCWKDAPNMDAIYLCGGSAKTLLPAVKRYYDNAQVHPHDPQLANARGAYKLGILKYPK